VSNSASMRESGECKFVGFASMNNSFTPPSCVALSFVYSTISCLFEVFCSWKKLDIFAGGGEGSAKRLKSHETRYRAFLWFGT
jgi:hypothetical protein